MKQQNTTLNPYKESSTLKGYEHSTLTGEEHTTKKTQIKCFRVEEKKVYDEKQYDLIWQANGKEEEIAFLLDKEQVVELIDLLNCSIHK